MLAFAVDLSFVMVVTAGLGVLGWAGLAFAVELYFVVVVAADLGWAGLAFAVELYCGRGDCRPGWAGWAGLDWPSP